MSLTTTSTWQGPLPRYATITHRAKPTRVQVVGWYLANPTPLVEVALPSGTHGVVFPNMLRGA